MNRMLVVAASVVVLMLCGCGGNTTDTPPGPDAGSVAIPPDASAPVPVTCSIVAPLPDALLTGAVDVQVQFAGPVAKVEILDGDAVLATQDVTAASPITVSVQTTTLSEGAHSLKARVHSAELSGDSTAVGVTVDNKAPVVNFGLTHLAMLSGTATIALVVTEPHVAKLQLLEGDTVLKEMTSVPDDILWDTTNAVEGLHNLKLSVTDTLGHTTVTDEQTIIVANHATLGAITYYPDPALVSVPENWQSVEIDVRGEVTNPGGIRRIITWLKWDPALQMNLEYSLGQGLCPHRGIKMVGKESREGEIVLELKRSDWTYTAAQEATFPAGTDPTTFPDNDDPLTLGTFFGHIAVLDAADHVNQSVPVKMYFLLFTE